MPFLFVIPKEGKIDGEIISFRGFIKNKTKNKTSKQNFTILKSAFKVNEPMKMEIILCGLLRLNLQNKEIAILRGVSEDAIKMARYRLSKKMNLETEKEVAVFLGKY